MYTLYQFTMSNYQGSSEETCRLVSIAQAELQANHEGDWGYWLTGLEFVGEDGVRHYRVVGNYCLLTAGCYAVEDSTQVQD